MEDRAREHGRDEARQSRRRSGREASGETPDLHSLAQDWVTLWQSELAALAADREVQETWQTMAALWAGAASAMLRALPRGQPDDGRGGVPPGAPNGGPAGSARAAEPARPTAAAAAPDTRADEIDRLARRIAELERRLADLERDGGG